MFTLGVYDLLSGQNLTGGRRIAGTGTIDLDGNVGATGGVQQKVVAGERNGAQYFLVPSANYADAQAVAKNITVVEVNTAQDAINFLNKLPPLKNQPTIEVRYKELFPTGNACSRMTSSNNLSIKFKESLLRFDDVSLEV